MTTFFLSYTTSRDTIEMTRWAIFMITMRVRQPNIVERVRREGRAFIETELLKAQDELAALKGGASEVSLLDYAMNHAPGRVIDFGIKILPRMFKSKAVVKKMLAMEWVSADLREANSELLLSDHPLVAVKAIDDPGHLQYLPLGRHHAFFAAPTAKVLNALRDNEPTRIVEMCNDSIVRQARRFVYGAADPAWLMERLTRTADK